MSITIRRATVEDAEAIAHVQIATWRDAYVGIVDDVYLAQLNIKECAQLARAQIADSNIDTLVAVDSNKICGFIRSGPIADATSIESMGFDAEIYTFYVLAENQGAGIGKRLIHEAARLLHERGLTRPVVWALTLNPWCSVYTRLGASCVSKKTITIGANTLSDSAFGWTSLCQLLTRSQASKS